jgi:hypothetical protein
MGVEAHSAAYGGVSGDGERRLKRRAIFSLLSSGLFLKQGGGKGAYFEARR